MSIRRPPGTLAYQIAIEMPPARVEKAYAIGASARHHKCRSCARNMAHVSLRSRRRLSGPGFLRAPRPPTWVGQVFLRPGLLGGLEPEAERRRSTKKSVPKSRQRSRVNIAAREKTLRWCFKRRRAPCSSGSPGRKSRWRCNYWSTREKRARPPIFCPPARSAKCCCAKRVQARWPHASTGGFPRRGCGRPSSAV